jgi:hypothetical protein
MKPLLVVEIPIDPISSQQVAKSSPPGHGRLLNPLEHLTDGERHFPPNQF